MTNKAARRHFLITVDGIDGTFATKTGGHTTASSTKVWDGGATEPDVLTSPPEHGDVTIGRAWDRDRDPAVVRRLRPQVGRAVLTIRVQPTDEDMIAYGDATTFFGKLTGLTDAEPDSGSSDPARLELVVAIAKVS